MRVAPRLADVLQDLLALVDDGPPTAAEVESALRRHAVARSVAGPNLEMPSWGREVAGAADVFLALEGELLGVRVHDDPRGWGAYADLAVRRGSLEDVESVVGPTAWMARNPDDFTSGERVGAYVDRSGWTIRVFTELTKDGTGVAAVTISYPSRDTPPRAPGEPGPVIVRRAIRPPGLASVRASAPSEPAADRCPNCGADTRDAGSFCGSCGAFLEWSRG